MIQLKEGERINHKQYGNGTVLNVDYKNDQITIEFNNHKRIKFIPSITSESLSRNALKKIVHRQRMVFRNGELYKPRREVKHELRSRILQEKDWFDILGLTPKLTAEFSSFTVDGHPFLNQGSTDPMFVVSRENPGSLIRDGSLIFRQARLGHGQSQYEFKVRAYASQEEIDACKKFAREHGKFVFGEGEDENND